MSKRVELCNEGRVTMIAVAASLTERALRGAGLSPETRQTDRDGSSYTDWGRTARVHS